MTHALMKNSSLRCLVLLGLLLSVISLPAGAEETSGTLEQEEHNITAEDLRQLKSHFALVRMYFKNNEEEVQGQTRWSGGLSYAERFFQSFIQQKRPLRLAGVAWSKDKVLVPETYLDDKYLDYIVVENMNGTTCTASLYGIVEKAPGLLLQLEQPDQLGLAPVVTGDARSTDSQENLYSVHIGVFNGDYLLSPLPVQPGESLLANGEAVSTLQTNASMGFRYYPQSFHPPLPNVELLSGSTSLIVSDNFVQGVMVHWRSYMEKGRPPLWQLEDLRQADILEMETYYATRDTLEAAFEERMPEVEVFFRQKAEDESQMFWQGGYQQEQQIPRNMYYYGIPVSRDTLFIPASISREFAKVIDHIEVTVRGKIVPAVFAGAYEDISAFLIRLEEPALPYDKVKSADLDFPRFPPLMTVFARREFGRKKIEVHYDRVLQIDRGYKDILEAIPLFERRIGCFFTDRNGALAAVLLRQRIEDEEKERFRQMGRYGYGSPEFIRFYTMQELAPLLEKPQDYLDKTIVWLPEEEAERKMWLGVEYNGIDKELAKAFEVEEPTKDGQVGYVISAVYPDSPAAKMGLEPGHILLSLQEPDETETVEFKVAGNHSGSFDFGGFDFPGQMGAMQMGYGAPPPWPSRESSLTQLLEVIGAGKKATLRYLDADRKEQSADFTIELAPADFSNAPKYKDEMSGLTVKDITYEVRFTLLLDADFEGVVVSDVEDGSPASVARLGKYQLIREIESEAVTDVETYRTIIETATADLQPGDKVTLRFTLQSLDKTHFADITIRAESRAKAVLQQLFGN